MDSAFNYSLITFETTVLDFTLKPFTLGHAYILDIFNSPFLHNSFITFEDVYFAAYVISNTYEDALDKINGQEFTADKWIKPESYWEFDVGAEASKISEHINFYSISPKRKESKEGSDSPSVPWQLLIATKMVKELGLTYTQLWNQPLHYTIAQYSALNYINGDRGIMSEQDIKNNDKLQKALDKKREELRKIKEDIQKKENENQNPENP